ncbi:MAG: hypothetical protein P5702_11595 [Limnospira sp. PMC 1291.21]|uniref:Uncharacterized protein n=2 Tax=Limnospira TaxID=2596745 RepID=B5W7U5_LIMMA|nr:MULTISPECIES: hypothetical protein [Limnospira]MDC0837893.1 hypothetical protein [Limnoraphis robusta]MDY7054408.1 hypothetical protein [Limnospira fusiformis LS22]QJB27459.1 hypothetical protein HFV01_18840 [Limnospira fusiformis SAG 85.79]UWU49839.1 hypothetical protein APLC1_4719 [Arthrospira platensis C1]EDZ92404.1 hypothetical protein AmaxDRAFT_4832 [Limnospira maxima CS-328]
MSKTWYAILTTYMILFFATGYINFFSNNYFAKTPENVAQITRDYDSPKKMNWVAELLLEDAQTYQDENNIASQSFNIVLGSIVSFLSATVKQKQ